MTKKTSDPFLLDWDLSELGDDEHFAHLVKFEGHEKIVAFADEKGYCFSTNIYFTGNFAKLDSLDFPYNDVRWPLVSISLIETLKKIGSFSYKSFKVAMLNDSVEPEKLYLQTGEPNPDFLLDKFYALQLLEHLDIFDWEKSVYDEVESGSRCLTFIDKLVLKEAPTGYPPIFRVSACPTLLFVSPEAKTAIENLGLKGLKFTAVEDFPFG